MWSPCGTVLTVGIHAVFWVWFQHSNEFNVLHWISGDISRNRWTCGITYFESFIPNQPLFFSLRPPPPPVAMLWLVRKTLRPLFEFFAWISIVTFWLAEAAGWFAVQKPLFKTGQGCHPFCCYTNCGVEGHWTLVSRNHNFDHKTLALCRFIC